MFYWVVPCGDETRLTTLCPQLHTPVPQHVSYHNIFSCSLPPLLASLTRRFWPVEAIDGTSQMQDSLRVELTSLVSPDGVHTPNKTVSNWSLSAVSCCTRTRRELTIQTNHPVNDSYIGEDIAQALDSFVRFVCQFGDGTQWIGKWRHRGVC
jgi:hypothetical protein